ncbi:MAG: CBS domain-containing protein [Bacilli bacterium]
MDINDVNYVYVKQELIDSIDYLINKIEHPVTVGDKILSNLNPLYCADITFSLKDVLKEMKNKQYSNVPVFQGEHFFGIFSSNTIFSKFTYDRSLDDTGKISEYKDYLPIENHFDEYFDYVSSSLPLRKCISKFKNIKKGKRLALLSVTEGGRPSDDIKGVITVEDCL